VKNTNEFLFYSVLLISILLIYYTFITKSYEEQVVADTNTYKNQNDHNYSDSGILEGTIEFIGMDCPPFSKQEVPPCSGPFPNLTITLYTNYNEKKIVATTKTDSNGNYQIILKPGKYLIYTSLESPNTIDITKANIYDHITIQKSETITKNYDIDTKIR
jgi:hypothetical protein